MGFFEPMSITTAAVGGIVPVDPSLAVLVLLFVLGVSALGISLAVAPPSALLRRLRTTGKPRLRHASPASA